jgi:branched-chain amino acid transport system permease protein
MSWSILPSVVVDSLVLASIYALVALGWVFIFRATGILNFAVGQFILLGCYLFFWVAFDLGLPFLLALPIALAMIALLGALAYLGTLKPLAGQPLFSPIMVTLGLSIVMTSAMVIIWGGTARLMPPPVAVTSYDLPFDASITNIGVATIVTALAVYAAIMTFLRKSKRGVQMRGTAENPLLASQRGINIDVIFMLAFAVAVGASTLAGLSFAYTTAGLAPTIVALGLRGLAPALIGGMDSIGGALIGSVIVAFIETAAVTQFGGNVKDMIAFLVLLVALAFRPHGLFGTPEIRRV